MKQLDLNTNILIYDIEECYNEIKILIKKAQSATQNAYAPYSKFKVGAAVLLSNGQIISGSNQENVAYPSGTCAERTTLFYANSQFPDIPVSAIAIAAYNNGDFTDDICTPCGACRQVILEAEIRYGEPIKVIMCGKNKVYIVDSIKALLPLCFGKDMLS